VKVLRPLYGVPESPMHWYKTYHGRHTKELCMNPTATDPRSLYKMDDDRLSRVIIIQVDDSAVGGTSPIRDMEIEKSRVFPTKDPVMISNYPAKFNGVIVRKHTDGAFVLSQKLSPEVPDNVSFTDFASFRA
jgi:hypothetical protein